VSGLRAPIRQTLGRPIDEIAAQRIWNGVRAARAGGRVRKARSRWMVLAAAAVVVLTALALLLPSRRGPLALDADRLVVEVDRDASRRTVRASDGSTLTLEPSTRLEVLDNSGDAFTTLLSRGRVSFDVVPRGGRRWTVECGVFAIEVVGTAFTVERYEGGARVQVERGEVVVRGERVPDSVVRLTAGQSLDVDARYGGAPPSGSAPASASPSASASASDDRGTAIGRGARSEPHDSPAPVQPTPLLSSIPSALPSSSSARPEPPEPDAWREHARAGEFDQAYAALGGGGVQRATASASVEELFTLADIARLSGHAAEAEGPLQRIVAEHGGDRRASVAALTLGRLYLDSLGRPAAAIAPLNRAIASGLPGGLAEDALARRVEAYGRSGQLDGARAAVDELERRFPSSGRLAAARRWTEPKE